MTKQELSNFIRRERMMQTLTQVDLAEKSGVSRQTIVDIESSRIDYSMDIALKVLAALNYTLVPTVILTSIPTYQAPVIRFSFANVLPAKPEDDPDLQEQKKKRIFTQSNRKK